MKSWVLKNCVIVLLVCVIVFVNAVDYGHPKVRHLHLVQEHPYRWPYVWPGLEDIQDHGGFCTLQCYADHPYTLMLEECFDEMLTAGDVLCVHNDLTYGECLMAGYAPSKGPVAVFGSYEEAVIYVLGFEKKNI